MVGEENTLGWKWEQEVAGHGELWGRHLKGNRYNICTVAALGDTGHLCAAWDSTGETACGGPLACLVMKPTPSVYGNSINPSTPHSEQECPKPRQRKKCLPVLWHYSWGDMNKCLPTADREPTRDPSSDPTKVHLVKHWVFLGLLTGPEVTQRPQHGWQLMKAGSLEHTTQAVGSSTGWRVSG